MSWACEIQQHVKLLKSSGALKCDPSFAMSQPEEALHGQSARPSGVEFLQNLSQASSAEVQLLVGLAAHRDSLGVG